MDAPHGGKEQDMATTTKTRNARRSMSAEHKAALAKGREEGLAVRRYLEALESSRPRRGRRRTPASIERKLSAIDSQLEAAEPLARLHLLQQRKDLQEELGQASDVSDMSELEKEFVRVAKSYGDRKGISYGTWRAAGVSAAVLQRAGVARSRA
jgi:uncharacterized protein YicC (UPF0701 family)